MAAEAAEAELAALRKEMGADGEGVMSAAEEAQCRKEYMYAARARPAAARVTGTGCCGAGRAAR